MERESWVSGPFFLKREGRTIAKAVKPSFLLRKFEVEYEGQKFELAAKGWTPRAYELTQDGQVVGSIRRKAICSRDVALDLPDGTPEELQMFLLWLGVLLWRRTANHHSGG